MSFPQRFTQQINKYGKINKNGSVVPISLLYAEEKPIKQRKKSNEIVSQTNEGSRVIVMAQGQQQHQFIKKSQIGGKVRSQSIGAFRLGSYDPGQITHFMRLPTLQSTILSKLSKQQVKQSRAKSLLNSQASNGSNYRTIDRSDKRSTQQSNNILLSQLKIIESQKGSYDYLKTPSQIINQRHNYKHEGPPREQQKYLKIRQSGSSLRNQINRQSERGGLVLKEPNNYYSMLNRQGYLIGNEGNYESISSSRNGKMESHADQNQADKELSPSIKKAQYAPKSPKSLENTQYSSFRPSSLAPIQRIIKRGHSNSKK